MSVLNYDSLVMPPIFRIQNLLNFQLVNFNIDFHNALFSRTFGSLLHPQLSTTKKTYGYFIAKSCSNPLLINALDDTWEFYINSKSSERIFEFEDRSRSRGQIDTTTAAVFKKKRALARLILKQLKCKSCSARVRYRVGVGS